MKAGEFQREALGCVQVELQQHGAVSTVEYHPAAGWVDGDPDEDYLVVQVTINGKDFRVFLYRDEAEVSLRDESIMFEHYDYSRSEELIEALISQVRMTLAELTR